jgi:phage baseplate assembly protein W
MARERVSKKINPLDLQKNVAIGIPLPLGGTPIFRSTYTTEDQALSNLKNLLLTRKGERPFQPLFGTEIPSLLFENINRDTLTNLEESVRADIEFWLPYINISEIRTTDLSNENRINISFTFSIGESGANQIIILDIDSQGGLSIA